MNMMPPHTTCVLRSRCFFLLHLRQDDAFLHQDYASLCPRQTQVSSKPFEFVPETKRPTRNYWKKKILLLQRDDNTNVNNNKQRQGRRCDVPYDANQRKNRPAVDSAGSGTATSSRKQSAAACTHSVAGTGCASIHAPVTTASVLPPSAPLPSTLPSTSSPPSPLSPSPGLLPGMLLLGMLLLGPEQGPELGPVPKMGASSSPPSSSPLHATTGVAAAAQAAQSVNVSPFPSS
jgi:hypothetical protein